MTSTPEMDKNNFLQVGRAVECGHCNPERFGEGLKEAEARIPNFECSCQCHDATSTPDKWEEILEGTFPIDKETGFVYGHPEALKTFIRIAIAEARAEERARLREKIDGMGFGDPNQAGQFALHADGYNQAVEEVLAFLTPESPTV